MMKFLFGFGKKSKTEMMYKELAGQLKEINSRLRSMEESIERQKSKQPQISIQTVHIHQPVLKSLEFTLDELDIENLSGSLNLGNNFGVKTGLERLSSHPDISRKSEQQAAPINNAKPSQESSSAIQSKSFESGLQRTPSGFRLRRN